MDGGFEATREELAAVNEGEQRAFLEGECDALVEMLAEEVTFFINGRQMTREDVGTFCRHIPRPFSRDGEVDTTIEAVGEDAGYVIKVTTFPGTPKVKVVTKVWQRGEDGWKMVHFQSTVLPPKGPPGGRPGGG